MTKAMITREAGAILNKSNRASLKLAFDTIYNVLAGAGVVPAKDDAETDDAETEADNPDDAETKQTKTKPATTKKENVSAKGDKKEQPDAKSKEAISNRRAIEAAGFSVADLANILQNAVNDLRPEAMNGEYVAPYRIVDIFDASVVYCVGWNGTEYYQVDYTVTEDGTVTLGTPYYVNRKVTYIAPAYAELTASEAGVSIMEPCSRLVEAVVSPDGETLIKLIAPGMGSTGYYSAEVLERDGPAAFPAGTKMFWDHDTDAEARARPEGTLTRFAGVLREDARYIRDHKFGAGLYARAEVKENFRADVNDLAADIGTSISADGIVKIGSINGARVPIVVGIKPQTGINNRVDFVTAAGAGGRVVSLFESARQRQPQDDHTIGDQTMTDEQVREAIAQGIAAGLAGVNQTIARLTEAATLRDAAAFAERTIAGPKYSTLPKMTRDRVVELALVDVPLTESAAIDAAKFAERIEQIARDEAGYLAQATGRKIAIGLGESRAPSDPPAGDGKNAADDDEADMQEMFERWGLSEAAAKIAAAGRTSGRARRNQPAA